MFIQSLRRFVQALWCAWKAWWKLGGICGLADSPTRRLPTQSHCSKVAKHYGGAGVPVQERHKRCKSGSYSVGGGGYSHVWDDEPPTKPDCPKPKT